MSTLRGDKLFGFQEWNTKNLVEFSLTDRTTRIHEVQQGDQFEHFGWVGKNHVWIGDVLLLGRNDRRMGTSTIYMFDLLGLEWKKTKMEVRGSIREMSTNDGNQLNVHVRGRGGCYSFHQFQFKETDSLTNLICKAVCRYSQGNQQFFQWFQSKLTKRSKFCAL
ncbi:hypothetical protein M3Y95_01037800 [Aphelenchoides besseyi]|nr:hypothetical protein M3Y95_01037800 [Aphelenchoides besseyi]